MNFKDWEKVSEDGKTCTLKHPKGHTMTIALGALPKLQREQIKRLNLADGTDEPLEAPADAPAAPPVVGAPTIDPATSIPSDPVNDISVRADGRATAPIAQEAKAVEEQQAVDTAKAKQAAVNETAIIGQRQNLAHQDADNIAELKRHTDEYANYIKQNPINAHQFQDKMGPGQKVTAGIGLFLGGLGTPFGGQNVALDMLNKQIDRNIEAQKQNADQQKNVWGAYEHLYGDQNIATNLAKISANDILTHQTNLLAAQLGTPQAKANADMLMATKNKENATLFGMTASRLTGLKNGTIPPNPGPSGMARMTDLQKYGEALSKKLQGSQTGFEEVNPKESGVGPTFPNGADNAAGAQSTEQILNPKAAAIFSQLKYDRVHTPEQIAKAQEQYGQAQKTDRILKEIDRIFPEMQNKATLGGWAAGHIDPHSIAAVGGATGLGLGAGAGAAAGGVGAVPGAIAGSTIGAGIGEGIGHGMKGAARAIGGTQESEYQTDKAALIGYIGNALAGTKVTPSEIENLVEEFLPTKMDSKSSAANKLAKLKDKILTLSNTDALDLMGMTNKRSK